MSAAERLLRRHLQADKQARRSALAWDLPTRLFKWALVTLVVTAWISSGFDDPAMTVHKAAGYGILTLLVYRFLWGFVGGSTARFTAFIRSPAAVIADLRRLRSGRERRYLGHSPAGGAMIIALLLACTVQVGLGLCASDGVLAAGPFADLVGSTWASRAAEVHAVWFYVILGLAAVHIAANLFHQFVRRDGLITAMVTGRKARAEYADAREATGGSSAVALLCLCVAAGLVYGGVALAGGQFFNGP